MSIIDEFSFYNLGLGLNFSNILELIKRNRKKKVVLYTVVPAEIKIGVGSNHINDPDKGGLISQSVLYPPKNVPSHCPKAYPPKEKMLSIVIGHIKVNQKMTFLGFKMTF